MARNGAWPSCRASRIRPQPWTIHAVSAAGAPGTNRFSHGIGLGDINGDGRDDILVPQGWWEAPADRRAGEWKFHPANFGENCAQMYAFDFDGDGDNDVLSARPRMPSACGGTNSLPAANGRRT